MENAEKELTDLIDLQDVTIDTDLPLEDRVRSFAEQVKDPYHYRVGDVIITSVFIGNGAVQRN